VIDVREIGYIIIISFAVINHYDNSNPYILSRRLCFYT